MIKKDWTDEDKLRANNLLKCLLKVRMWEDAVGADGYVLGASIIWLKELIQIMETPIVQMKPKEEKDMPARVINGDNNVSKQTKTKKDTRDKKKHPGKKS